MNYVSMKITALKVEFKKRCTKLSVGIERTANLKMNDDGTLNKEGAKSAIEPLKNDDPQLYEKVVKIGKECAKEVVVDDDKCKYATKLTECGAKKGKEMGIDVSVLQ